MEYENKYASKGVAGAGLGLGIGGAALGLINNGALGGLFGGNAKCSEDHYVNRYEAEQNAKIANLEMQVAMRDANTFTMGEMNRFREYVDNRFSGIEAQIGQQSVFNATTTSTLNCLIGQIATLQGLTKTVVPIESVCPKPMPQYNSWTAPTTAA